MSDTDTTLSITADDLIAMNPCDDWPESRIREMAGEKRWSALEILSLEQVPAKDRLWVVLRSELISEPVLHEIACRFAEDVLTIWERHYPDDRRPHEAIAAKRAWLRGEMTDAQLAAAVVAAWNAAVAAAGAAPGAAAWATARAAAWAAWAAGDAARAAACGAWDASRDAAEAAWAASAAALERQIEIVRAVLESEVNDGDYTD